MRAWTSLRVAVRRCALGVAMLPCAAGSDAGAAAPAGIYSLGQARNNPGTPGDERLGGIRDYDFVSGFTLRLFWNDLEPAAGVYDFGVIDEAIRRVAPLGQSLSVEIFTNSEPQYVLDGASATYVDHRGGTNPVPWDPLAQARHAALYAALGAHVVTGVGAPHPLRLDATLTSIDAAPAGLNFGVRDLNDGIVGHPQYTQQRYVDAVAAGVAAATAAFPHDQNFLAFFSFDDGAPGPHVDDQLIARLGPLYNGPGQPQLAVFAENLSDEWPVPLANGNGMGNNPRPIAPPKGRLSGSGNAPAAIAAAPVETIARAMTHEAALGNCIRGAASSSPAAAAMAANPVMIAPPLKSVAVKAPPAPRSLAGCRWKLYPGVVAPMISWVPKYSTGTATPARSS